MQTLTLHEQMLRNPPTDRMRDVHMLHHTKSVPMLDETSALHGNMQFLCRNTTTRRVASNHVSLSPLPRQCVARWDHINSCLHHASNWTCAHDHVLRALERICKDAGFATTHKRVLASEGNRRADLEIRNIRVGRPICW